MPVMGGGVEPPAGDVDTVAPDPLQPASRPARVATQAMPRSVIRNLLNVISSTSMLETLSDRGKVERVQAREAGARSRFGTRAKTTGSQLSLIDRRRLGFDQSGQTMSRRSMSPRMIPPLTSAI